MSIRWDKRNKRWRFEFDRYVGGQRLRKDRLLPAGWTRAQADAFEQKESSALLAIAAGIAKPRRTIDEAVTHYVRERCPGLKHGAGTARELDTMADWWRGRAIEDLPDVCTEYAADQYGALKPATIKNRIAYLRAACRWAWKRHQLGDSDPGARVVAPQVRNARQVVIDRAQMVALARACRHPGVRAVIRIAFYSGMRVGEILTSARIGTAFVMADTKNGHPRIVPMHYRILGAARVPMPKRSEIDYYWPLARVACGMQYVTLHDLRHAAASAMINAGEDLATVGAVLGHKSAASTKRYSHWGTERLAAAVGKIGRR